MTKTRNTDQHIPERESVPARRWRGIVAVLALIILLPVFLWIAMYIIALILHGDTPNW